MLLRRQFYFCIQNALIAQPVEQLPFKEKVPGSNPGGRTRLFFNLQFIIFKQFLIYCFFILNKGLIEN